MTKTVLVAEDDQDNLTIVVTILNHFGYQTAEAMNGIRALELIEEARPDLIILDVSMPGLNGWEVCRRLKGNPATSDIPVIMLTAHVMAEERRKGMECGADEFLAKPVEPRAIVKVIEQYIGAP